MSNKVFHIGFGLHPFWEGGMVVYQESLMKMISDSGWQTSFLVVAPRYDFFYKPYVRISLRGKVRILEVINSPLVPIDYHSDPDEHCKNEIIESLVAGIIDRERPDIVHLHDLRTYPASIIDRIFNMKVPMVKTIHNYWDICPQGDLIFKGEKACVDFDKGRACIDCLSTFSPYRVSLKHRLAGAFLNATTYPIAKALLGRGIMGKGDLSEQKKYRAQIAYSPSSYNNRRQFFVERLNKIDVIHATSRGVADILEHYGVDRERIKIIPLSSQTLDLISPKPLRNNSYPVVFGYCGGISRHKGFDILLEAFSKLDQKKAKLVIFGITKIDTRYKKDLNIEARKRFLSSEFNRSFSGIDVGVVPSVWGEVFGIIGIEFLQARIPVIGSKIGGITEWLKDKENGFFVSPNDANDLREKMQLFVDDPSLISRLQSRIRPWKSMSEHVREITDLYKEMMRQ